MLRKYGDVHIVEIGYRGSEGGEGDAQKVWGCSYDGCFFFNNPN